MKVISMCLWRRLDIAKRVLRALSRCDGIRDYHLIIHVDGRPDKDMVDWASTIGCCSKQLIVTKNNIGCNSSTRKVLQAAFSKSDYVIHVEEDVELAPDALRFFEWGATLGSDPSLLTIGAWRDNRGWRLENNTPFPMGDDIEKKAVKCGAFHCWGWATWRDRWERINEIWTKKDDFTLSWDTRITEWRHAQGLFEVIPLVSRALNIGAGGIHRGEALLSYWAGSIGFVPPTSYRLVS